LASASEALQKRSVSESEPGGSVIVCSVRNSAVGAAFGPPS
jgi:hypothetical protein